MSTSGLTNQYIPPTLDGLTVVDADQIYIDGQLVDLTTLVPYTGADKPVDVGAQPIRTTYAPVATNDVVNLQALTDAVAYVDTSVALTYLSKISTVTQSVAGPVSFTNGVQTSTNKDVSLASTVIITPNYPNATVYDGGVTAGSLFGTITNSGGIYQSTSSGDGGVLVLGSGLSSGRVRLMINLLVNDTNGVAVSLFGSSDGVNPYQTIASHTFPPNTTAFWLSDTTFTLSYPYLILICNTASPGLGATVQWYGLTLYQMGVAMNNVTVPAQTGDRVVVLDTNKRLVASGINTTKLGYLDNVSSDIQTQLNSKASITYVDTGLAGKLNLSGSNANQNINLGSFKVQSNATPTASTDYITKAYGDSTYALTSALAGYLPLTGGTLSGPLTISSGALTANTRLLGVPDAVSGGNFWIGLTGSDSEVNRLAISLIGNQTTGTCSGVSISKSLTVSDGLETNISNALKVTQTLVSSTLAAFSTSGVLAPTLATVPSPPPPFVWYASGGLCIGLQVSGWTPGISYTRYKFVFTNCGRYDTQGPTTLQWFQGSLSAPISASFLLPLTSSPGTITGYFTPSNIGGTIFCAITSSVGSASFLYYQSFALYRADTNIYSLRAQDNAYFAGDQVVSGTTTTTQLTVSNNATYASRISNPSTAQVVITGKTTSERLLLGAYYTAGVGSCCGIQASDYYSGADHGQNLLINAIGGNVGIGSGNGGVVYDPNCKFTIHADYSGGNTGGFCINASDTASLPNYYNLRIYPFVQSSSNIAYQFMTYNSTAYNSFKILSTGNVQFDTQAYVNSGDSSKITFGPNATWSSYLSVGAGTNGINSTTAQVISTNGNVHIDPAYNRSTYINFYQNQAGYTGTILMYGDTTLTGNFIASGTVTIGANGSYLPGSIYSDANWGMIFRAKVATPGIADFLWSNSADVHRMCINNQGRLGIGGGTDTASLPGTFTIGADPIGGFDSITWLRTTQQPNITMGTNYISYASSSASWASDANAGDMILRTNFKVIRFNVNNGGTSALYVSNSTVGVANANAFSVGGGSCQTRMGLMGAGTGGNFGNTAAWPSDANALLITSASNQGPYSSGLLVGYNGSGYVTSLTPSVSWQNLYLYGATIGAAYFGTITSSLTSSGWSNVSDEREKDDIQDLKTSSSLKRVLSLKPKHYKRKFCDGKTPVPDDVKQKRCIGFVAQEVQLTNPHCVSEWENENVEKTEQDDGKRLALSYNDYIVHLVGAVQEQQKQIEILTQRNQLLENHARQQEAKQKEQEERLKKAEERMEKMASLISQLISSK